MTHRRRPLAAGLLGAALVLTAATACSSDDSESDDAIDGAQTGEETPAEDSTEQPTEPDPTPSDDGIDRPDIEVADSLELIFEGEPTGDPTQDAILGDSEWQIKAVYEVLTTYDAENSSIGFYTKQPALGDDMGWVQDAMDQGLTSAGTMRFFNREVASVDGDEALVAYCRDFTEVSTTDFETGEVVEPADPDALPTHYVATLERNDEGVWQTVSTDSERESAECQ